MEAKDTADAGYKVALPVEVEPRLYNTPGGGSVLCIIRYYVLYVYNTERIIGVGDK